MKQTAVEFYAEGLENLQYNPLEKNGYVNAKQKLFEQAKEMEEQQIQDAYRISPNNEIWSNSGIDYCNETYNK